MAAWRDIPHDIIPRGTSAEETLRLWREAREEPGVPVLLLTDELLTMALDENVFDESAPVRLADLYDPEAEAEALGRPRDKGRAAKAPVILEMADEGEIWLARVPVKKPWQIFRYLPVGDWNACPDARYFEAFCKAAYETFGAAPLSLSGDMMEIMTARRPTPEEALRLAKDIFAFDPDAVWQGAGSIYALADSLVRSDTWQFWWD